ncbi:MAG: hypothetical protein NZ899_08775 [Thermoguttaceae bacterium]|nr:hypothetical protein [Thermoguttaceae bacterium]MDW8077961.1 hypothetical protein [Thermoguttaceae bacterium]
MNWSTKGSGLLAGACLLVVVAAPQMDDKVSANQPEQLIFEDRLQGQLAQGWYWLREHPGYWRFGDKGLEIRVEPGVATTVKNALVRPAPNRAEASYAIEVTVNNLSPLTNQYEQAGITWYVAKKPVFKLVKELVDGQVCIIPGKKPIPDKPVRLRLVVSKDRFIAQYKPEGEKEFLTAAEGSLPPPSDDEVSIQCYNGPADAEHWIRFEDFRIWKLPNP